MWMPEGSAHPGSNAQVRGGAFLPLRFIPPFQQRAHLESVDAELEHLGDVGPGPAEVEAAQGTQPRHASRQH